MQNLQRQRVIYIYGLAGCVPKTPLSFAGLEHKARQILSAQAYAYMAGAAGNETTIDLNRQAIDQIKIHPHLLGGVQEVSMQLKWKGHTLPAPFVLAPFNIMAELELIMAFSGYHALSAINPDLLTSPCTTQ